MGYWKWWFKRSQREIILCLYSLYMVTVMALALIGIFCNETSMSIMAFVMAMIYVVYFYCLSHKEYKEETKGQKQEG